MFFKLIPISVWKNKKVKQRLSWYYDVMQDKKPAKYFVCKRIHTEMDIKNLETSELCKEHEQLSKIARNKIEKIKLSVQ